MQVQGGMDLSSWEVTVSRGPSCLPRGPCEAPESHPASAASAGLSSPMLPHQIRAAEEMQHLSVFSTGRARLGLYTDAGQWKKPD